jgi:dTDP-4-amino-4,6-dideoxygalactose transaminase
MILMNDFKAEPAEIRQAMLAAVERVLASGWYILGKEVADFEAQWAALCGVRHGVGVGNGMDAIELALRSLDIGAGDEVITTPMTAFASVLGIRRAGAQPVLADIDTETGLLDIDSVRRCITPKTRAVLLVHLYGQVRDMAAWRDICCEHGIELIEDCAQAHYAHLNDQVAGSFGRAGAYSFYPTKNLGAVGDGGMLVTSDAGLAERAARLRNYGQSLRYSHPELGMNSRLDEVQAAILQTRLAWMDGFTSRRKAIAQQYLAGIANSKLTLLASPQEASAHVYHLFVVLCQEREAFQRHMNEHQVQTLIHYPIPVHLQPPCLNIARDPEGLPRSEAHAATCVSIPCHPQMSDADVALVLSAINAF